MPTFSRPASPFRPAREPGTIAVLILDDERYDRHRLARLCSGLDFPCAVHNAKTLKEFEAQLEDEEFGLILLDYALPDGTGLDAMSLLRLNARNLNTPTLMISGQPQMDIAARAEAAGCAGYLSKDALSSDDFANAVRGALARRKRVKPVKHDSFSVEEVQAFLSGTTARCAQDIKPMVSRLMRQMRNLRAAQGGAEKASLQDLEQDCLTLWSFLVDMEREDGAALLSDALAPKRHGGAAGFYSEKQDRPPSPFTARRH